MSVSMLDNISYKGKKPDNARSYFPTIADMVAYSENYLPDIYITLCGEDNNQYKFIRSNDVDPVLGKWRLLESGGGDLSSYYTKTETNTLLADKVDKVSGKDLSSNDYTSEEKTKLASLENYDDTALTSRVTATESAITTLNGNSTITGSVDNKVANCLTDSKSYTDTSIQNAIRQTAIVCDEKPTISGTTITYIQNGVTKTITSDNKTKFYYTVSDVNYSTIWIENHEFTDTVASVDFADYVSKTNDVISTYTGSEADKTKIPDLASIDALKALVDSDLDDKLDIADVDSSVTSSSDNPVKSSALYTKFTEKVDLAQGVANEGKILQVNSSGNLALVDPSAIGTDASAVSYSKEGYSSLNTVKKALDNLIDKVYYVAPTVSTFTMTPSATEYEIGSTINELVFAWTYNKDVTSQSLTDCTLTDETVRTATYSTAITSNKTFTLTASDGTQSCTASKNISFKHKIYWGSSSTTEDFTSAFILGLSGKKFATSTKGSYSMTVGSGEFGYLCYPSTWGNVSSWWIGGFEVTTQDCGTIAFTNASGNTTTFRITRTTKSGLGSITVEIK